MYRKDPGPDARHPPPDRTRPPVPGRRSPRRPAPRARATRGRAEGIEPARRLGLDKVPPWASYIARGRRECAFSQLGSSGASSAPLYDRALEPVGLRASQLALMWAIVATEPVDMTTLGEVTYTDQTTLSRTVQNLRRMRLASVRPGDDRRVKLVSLTAAGKARFAAAMPYWENAQRDAARLMSLDGVNELGKQVRRADAAEGVRLSCRVSPGRGAWPKPTARCEHAGPPRGFPRRLGVPAGERRGRPRTTITLHARVRVATSPWNGRPRGRTARSAARNVSSRHAAFHRATPCRAPRASGSVKAIDCTYMQSGGGAGEDARRRSRQAGVPRDG